MRREGYPSLLRLVERGAKAKATGFGHVKLDVAKALQEISATDSGALMFGTDLPGTRAARPFSEADVDLIVKTLEEALARRILFANAADWYMRGESRR